MEQKIGKWYAMGLWTAEMVRQAGEKGILTPAQIRGILEE